MANNTQVQLLKEIIEFGHNLTINYSKRLKDTDPFINFEINDITLNNLYWIVAHLTYFEDLLLAKALGFKGNEIEWLQNFGYGSLQDEKPVVSFIELLEIASITHINCMNNLDKLKDINLQKDNKLGFRFGKDKSYKAVIKHHIRHESLHNGHLSTLCKLNGIKTF